MPLGTNQIAKRMFRVFFSLLPHFQPWMLSLLPYLKGEASPAQLETPLIPPGILLSLAPWPDTQSFYEADRRQEADGREKNLPPSLSCLSLQHHLSFFALYVLV